MKILVAPLQPHCFAYGGFEIQMISALEAARECGANISRLDPWSRDDQFDILHLWGLNIANLNMAEWAKRAGKRVVVTTLLPYFSPIGWVRNLASLVAGPARIRRKFVKMVDKLVVVNDLQAKSARTLLGFSGDKIHVIPNIIQEQYFAAGNDKIVSNDDGYVLCTGNICPRKNQLTLARVCIKLNIPLLIVGDVLTGEGAYGRDLEKFIAGNSSSRWIRGLPTGSAELVEVYRRAAAFALISHNETQPISLLEAAAVGKPLLIADRPYARQEFYRNAMLVNPCSIDSIMRGLNTLLADPNKYLPNEFELRRCARSVVGKNYVALYTEVLK